MSNPKPRRLENRELLNKIKEEPCIICGKGPCDPSHIKTQGSGGPDTRWNVVPMCRKHHTEWGLIGRYSFVGQYPDFGKYLQLYGWSWDKYNWYHKEIDQ